MVLSWILTFNMLSDSCKVGNVALGLSLSISQSEIWVNLLGHPPLGKLWHYVNTRLPQTSKLPKYLFLWRWSHLLLINNQVYPIGITGLLLTLLIPTEILMAYLVFHITAIFFAVISYLIFIPTGVLRGSNRMVKRMCDVIRWILSLFSPLLYTPLLTLIWFIWLLVQLCLWEMMLSPTKDRKGRKIHKVCKIC